MNWKKWSGSFQKTSKSQTGCVFFSAFSFVWSDLPETGRFFTWTKLQQKAPLARKSPIKSSELESPLIVGKKFNATNSQKLVRHPSWAKNEHPKKSTFGFFFFSGNQGGPCSSLVICYWLPVVFLGWRWKTPKVTWEHRGGPLKIDYGSFWNPWWCRFFSTLFFRLVSGDDGKPCIDPSKFRWMFWIISGCI